MSVFSCFDYSIDTAICTQVAGYHSSGPNNHEVCCDLQRYEELMSDENCRCTQDMSTIDEQLSMFANIFLSISISLVCLFSSSVLMAGWYALISGLIVLISATSLGRVYLKCQMCTRREMRSVLCFLHQLCQEIEKLFSGAVIPKLQSCLKLGQLYPVYVSPSSHPRSVSSREPLLQPQ